EGERGDHGGVAEQRLHLLERHAAIVLVDEDLEQGARLRVRDEREHADEDVVAVRSRVRHRRVGDAVDLLGVLVDDPLHDSSSLPQLPTTFWLPSAGMNTLRSYPKTQATVAASV